MLIIGLTGGIGCGKSAVTDLFTRLGVPVIDADETARQVVEPGKPALQQISDRFGDKMIQADGRLNRRRLRQTIFSDPQARQDLEGILHPLIRQRMRQHLETLQTPYAILSIPLLLETGQADTVDRVLVVDCPETLQIERVCRRDDIDPAQAQEILAAQVSRQRRLQAADDVIDNSGTLQQLIPQVEALHRKYLSQS